MCERAFSGVFRIATRRERGAVYASRRVGCGHCGGGVGPLPGKIFCPLIFFYRQKTRTRRTLWVTGFYGSTAKRSLHKHCKNYLKTHGQSKGAVAPSPPLNTPLRSLICATNNIGQNKHKLPKQHLLRRHVTTVIVIFATATCLLTHFVAV